MEDESVRSCERQRWPVEYLEGVNECDAEYLVKVGLPTGQVGTLDVVAPAPVRRGAAIVVARDGDVPIVLQQSAPSVVAREDGLTRPVNSTVEAFASCLASYDAYRQRVRGLDEQDALLLIAAVDEKMRLIDGDVLADPESYWAAVLEQMRDGLL